MNRFNRSRFADSTVQVSPRTIYSDSTFQTSNRTTCLTSSDKFMEDKAKSTEQKQPIFHDQFKEDCKYWQKASPEKLTKIRAMIEQSLTNPSTGTGHPKRLKYEDGNAWSRKIDKKNRFVYLVIDDQVHFIQARYHYNDK